MGTLDTAERALRSLACLTVLPAGLAAYSSAALIHALAGGSPRDVDYWYHALGRFSMNVAGTDLEVHGIENVDPEQAYVVVCNHESNWDPIALLAGIPALVLRFVAKRQIMRIPILGQALALSGNIEVERKRGPDDVQRVRSAMSDRHPDVSILFFAEGTRARDGAYREFRKGAFATALKQGLPILPVAVGGAFAIWKPESPIIRKGPLVVEIGPPIPVEGLDYDARDTLLHQTHETVGKLRARARQRVRDLGAEPGGID